MACAPQLHLTPGTKWALTICPTVQVSRDERWAGTLTQKEQYNPVNNTSMQYGKCVAAKLSQRPLGARGFSRAPGEPPAGARGAWRTAEGLAGWSREWRALQVQRTVYRVSVLH